MSQARVGQIARNRRSRLLRGRIFSGLGQGAYFTQLDWVKEQCARKLGFIPYPGTLNLRLAGSHQKAWQRRRDGEGVVLEPPEASFCQGKCYPVLVGEIAGAIVMPLVEGYPADIVEIMAPVNIKETLGVGDGDVLVVKLL